jgi:hypothetical protein
MVYKWVSNKEYGADVDWKCREGTNKISGYLKYGGLLDQFSSC